MKTNRQLLAIVALVMVTLPAWAQQVKYSVSGVSQYNGKKVSLIDRLTDRPINSTIVADGKFSMEGMADKDAFMALNQEGVRWLTLFFNDGTPVFINVNDSTLKGSPLNERLVNYDLEMARPINAFMQKWGALSQEEAQKRANEWQPEMRKAWMERAEMLDKLFVDERGTIIPVAFVEDYEEILGYDKLDSVLNNNPIVAAHPYVKKQQQAWAQQKAIENAQNAFIGQQFTDLEEADVDGKMHKLSEYVGKGKWVLVDFWASWCGPCRAEMPNVLAAYNKYHAKGFDIVGLSFDNKKEPWVKAIADLNMPWPQLSDLKGWKTIAADVYSVNAIPDNLLIDPNGKIVARGLRSEALQNKLKEIFGE